MSGPTLYLDGRVAVHAGDCFATIKALADNSIDAVVTDPPYSLTSIVKRFGKTSLGDATDTSDRSRKGADGYARLAKGFMGKAWDNGSTAFSVDFWAEVWRVLKPGAHVVAFGGTRTYHRLACAIEDAGFEIRDCISYLYGTGFPKSHNVSKNTNEFRCRCEVPAWQETEHSLHSVRPVDVSTAGHVGEGNREILLAGLSEPSLSPARRKQSSCDAGRGESSVEGRGNLSPSQRELRSSQICSLPAGVSLNGAGRRIRDGASPCDGDLDQTPAHTNGVRPPQGSCAVEQSEIELGTLAGQPLAQERRAWNHCERCGKPIIPDGFGTALKPACELVVLGRKPLSEGTVAANCLKWNCGALNIDACRVEAPEGITTGGNKTSSPLHMDREASINRVHERASPHSLGRWPANLIHDNSPEVLAAFPETTSGGAPTAGNRNGAVYGEFEARSLTNHGANEGSAARFFASFPQDGQRFWYGSKADGDDRRGSRHPTVKPVALMQWLCRLVCPPGGTILDPFSGTGTTGEAAYCEGFNAVLIEREVEYLADIARRMKLCLAGPDERARESIKARNAGKPDDHGPLFAPTIRAAE